MTEPRTLARPYARAIFELANQQQQLAQWAQLLSLLAMLITERKLATAYADPKQSKVTLIDWMTSIANEAGYDNCYLKSFLYLLSQYQRLTLLPEIAILFNETKIQQEQQLLLIVTSALPIAAALKTRLEIALAKRWQQPVSIDYQIDNALIGGIVIRIGDQVVDGSIQNQLKKLKNAVTHE